MSSKENYYDIAIIGGGPAGLTAGLYAARAKRKTIIYEMVGSGGQMSVSHTIENYPAFPKSISGMELSQLFEDHAKAFGAEIILSSVKGLKTGKPFHKVISDKGEIECGAVIIASGAKHRHLDIPGENELAGKGVSYCGTCDGMFFRGKEIVVVGGGDAAVDESLFLTKYVTKLTLIHRRDTLRAEKILQERAFANPKINFMWDSVITEIDGSIDTGVTSVKIKNLKTNNVIDFPTQGVFVFVGHIPNTDFLPPEIQKTEHGTLITNFKMETDVKGIYAAGDVRRDTIRQIITAAGEGATAAYFADKYLSEELKI